ncbi:MAG: YggS family pyridoxal phosphate-dependent enzyme [Pyrinomonadaceae bacterium]
MNREVQSLDQIRARFANVITRIAAAAARSGRRADGVTLVAITKNHPADVLRMGLEVGMRDFGENRVQEAEAKINEIGRAAVQWHLVGHLQSNKARRAVKLFDVIHSLDNPSLAEQLDRLCSEERRELLSVMVQVDLGQEEAKSGVDESQVQELVNVIRKCTRLRLIGLMTLPPFFDDPELTRPYFRRLRNMRDEFQRDGHFGNNGGQLSMGMTNDFEVAIEEGATMVRVGTAIFGERVHGC